jgi:hypothetical protein
MDDDSTVKVKGWSLEKCKRKYLDFVSTKREELLEARKARRYQHGDQWDAPEIKVLGERGQAVRTHNQVAKKVNGIVGLIEKLRQDARAYPRNPDPEQAPQPPAMPQGQPQLGQPPQMGPMPGQTAAGTARSEHRSDRARHDGPQRRASHGWCTSNGKRAAV